VAEAGDNISRRNSGTERKIFQENMIISNVSWKSNGDREREREKIGR
jgi:hypothetical protein